MPVKINRIPMGKSNSYLIKGKDGFILIDAGMPGKVEKVLKVLKNYDATLSDINLLIVTHVHNDHVGSLNDIKEESSAPILVHEKENNLLLQGYSKFPAGTMAFSKIISRFANNVFFSKDQFKPIKADIIMNNEFDLSDYGVDGKVLHTPGHTEGSIAVIIENKHCFTGDTLFNILPNSVYPPFADDREALLKSWEKLKMLKCEIFYPGHGKEFSLNKFEASFEKYINKNIGLWISL